MVEVVVLSKEMRQELAAAPITEPKIFGAKVTVRGVKCVRSLDSLKASWLY